MGSRRIEETAPARSRCPLEIQSHWKERGERTMEQATPEVKRRLSRVRLRWVIVVLDALLLLAVVIAAYYRYTAPANSAEKNDVARTVVQGLGALVLLLGLFFTWRNVQIGRANLLENQQANRERERLGLESHVTERFTKA